MEMIINKRSFLNEIGTIASALEDGKNYRLSIKEQKQKRSLDANAYMWVLCGKLAEKLRTTKEQIYRNEIREVGVYDVFCVQNKALDSVMQHWQERGTGWVCEVLDDAKNVKDAKVICMYYGSSTYSSAEMSRLIDNVVQSCKEQGIPTMTPDEIEEMKARWANDR